MIKITFTECDGAFAMKCSGHSGYASKGTDIVCAAATMLAYTYAQALQNLYDEGILPEEPVMDFSDGEAFIRAEASGETVETVRTVLRTVQAGCMCLASNYQEHVSVRQTI